MTGLTLESLLVDTHLISPTQLAIAQRDAQKSGKRLAPTLIDLRFVGDRRFAEWIAGATRIPLLDPIPEDSVRQLERRLPRAIAREYEVIPVALRGNELTVALINPLDEACLDVLRTTTGLSVRPVVAIYGALKSMVMRFYPEDDVESTIQPKSAVFATPPAESQLDRIERQIGDIRRRLDAIEAALRMSS